MKVFVMSDRLQEGLQTVEGFIQVNNKYNQIDNKYFKLQHDYSVDDYDYSGSDITEKEEEILHDKIMDNDYVISEEESLLLKYLHSALFINGRYSFDTKEIGLKQKVIKVWENSKGFIHFTIKAYSDFNIGKVLLCKNEYSFNKKGQLKYVGYDIV